MQCTISSSLISSRSPLLQRREWRYSISLWQDLSAIEYFSTKVPDLHTGAAGYFPSMYNRTIIQVDEDQCASACTEEYGSWCRSFDLLYCYLQYVNLRIQLHYSTKQNITVFTPTGQLVPDGKEQLIHAASYHPSIHPSHPVLKHTYRQTKEFVYGLCALYIGRTKLIIKLVIIISAA